MPIRFPRRWLPLAPLLSCASCSYLDARLVDLHDCVLYRWNTDAFGVAVEAKLGPLDAAVGGWYSEYGWGKDTFWQRPGYVRVLDPAAAWSERSTSGRRESRLKGLTRKSMTPKRMASTTTGTSA